MFIETDIIEFINRIINSNKSNNSEIKNNIIKFRDQLVLTQMTDQETIDKVDKIISCLDSIINIKNSLGFIDISVIINAPTEKGKKLRKVPITQREYADKHYNHYERDNSSTSCYSCGSSSTSRSRC